MSDRIDRAEDERFMALALSLGRRGLGNTAPNPAVGAVVVRHGAGGPEIVGRGWTQPGGRPHAEQVALAAAGERARGATLYVTLEPCSHFGKTPPCADAVIAAGIGRVVSAIEDLNPLVAGRGHARIRARGIAVDIGLGAEEARLAHAGHFRRMKDGRPHITLKLAVSADGKVGASGRRPVAITGEAVRDRVHLMRAQSDAILIGIGTALADDPALTCRLPGLGPRSPVRIVLDSHLRLPLDAQLVRTANDTPVCLVADVEASAEKERVLREHGVEVLRVETREGRRDLVELFRLLAILGLTRLMVEGGPIVAADLIGQDLVDEAFLFCSAKVVGAEGIDALEGLPLTALTQSPRLRSHGMAAVGEDTVEHFARVW